MSEGLYSGVSLDDLGSPVLVCRWRLAGGRLPMAGRHLRALRNRTINGQPLPDALVSWAKEHIDWTLERGAGNEPDGVLMLVVDERAHAAMAVGPYRPLRSTTLRSLVGRARHARQEAEMTGVAPETLWLVNDDRLEWLDERINVASGAATLVRDLGQTLGMSVTKRSEVDYDRPFRAKTYEGGFLVSDEHGVVVPSDRDNEQAQRFADGYHKLLEATMRRKERHERSGT